MKGPCGISYLRKFKVPLGDGQNWIDPMCVWLLLVSSALGFERRRTVLAPSMADSVRRGRMIVRAGRICTG